jgi:hypothetical protein
MSCVDFDRFKFALDTRPVSGLRSLLALRLKHYNTNAGEVVRVLNLKDSRRGPSAESVGTRTGTRTGIAVCSPTSGRFDERAQIQCGWEEIR